MAKFEILRMQRLKSFYSIRRSVKHALRAQETPNADPSRLKENSFFFAEDVATAMQNFKKRMPEKIRKNAVYAVEFLVTASPEVMKEKTREAQDSYFADALKYLQDKHGAENVVFAGVHRDETTPHMYAYVVPIDERGKLNCRHFYGAKNALSELQSDFHAKVGEVHGLDRGIKGSKARHTSIQEYYARVKKNEAENYDGYEAEFDPPTLADRINPTAYGQRVSEDVAYQFQEKLRIVKITNYRLQDQLQGQERELNVAQNTAERFKNSHTKLSELESLTKYLTRFDWERLKSKRADDLQSEQSKKEMTLARREAKRAQNEKGVSGNEKTLEEFMSNLDLTPKPTASKPKPKPKIVKQYFADAEQLKSDPQLAPIPTPEPVAELEPEPTREPDRSMDFGM